jgi:protein-tyrosine phosphatase
MRSKPIRLARKGLQILGNRLRTQGLRVTAIWALVRGWTFLTGVPTARFTKVTEQLYVGPQHRRRGRRKLASMGITAVLNMRAEFDDAAHDLTLGRYCHLPTLDDHAPSLEQLRLGVAFIQGAVSDGEKVYIHCAGGVGRAPTMAAAYLIAQGADVPAAVARVRAARPFIRIMPPQMELLHEFQSTLRPME